ncbi:uncharacterized protein LOC141913882 isoform X2 [Tubulanus polymorphus]|uniref:uncharacterized protein LOC141913882 isoform X2 n=1 Tax=Tubulanus polymorphus TaxID=672921 RepID=UPI003DA1F1B7
MNASISFDSPDVQKEFPGLYTSSRPDDQTHYEESEPERVKKKERDGKKKEKKEKKDKGYKQFEEENSDDEFTPAVDEIKSPLRSKKHGKPSFKFAKPEKFQGIMIKKKEKDPEKKERKKDGAGSNNTGGSSGGGVGMKRLKKKKPATDLNSNDYKPIFGVALTVAVARSRSHDGIMLPAIFRECIDYIEEHGLSCEGIYRISGVKSKIQSLKDSYNRGRPVFLYEHEPNIVASLLKLFLRELPEPVLTTQLMPKFEEASTIKDVRKKVDGFKQLITELPEPNRLLVSWMIVHMTRIIQREKENKMSLQNVSIVLSPTMQISHRVLNVFFSFNKELFADTEIKRYVPPLKPATSRWSLELPDAPNAIEEELHKQESLLNQLHNEMSAGNDDSEIQEQLWEVQRVVTQLKRKLKLARKAQQQASVKPSLATVPSDGEDIVLNLELQTPKTDQGPSVVATETKKEKPKEETAVEEPEKKETVEKELDVKKEVEIIKEVEVVKEETVEPTKQTAEVVVVETEDVVEENKVEVAAVEEEKPKIAVENQEKQDVKVEESQKIAVEEETEETEEKQESVPRVEETCESSDTKKPQQEIVEQVEITTEVEPAEETEEVIDTNQNQRIDENEKPDFSKEEDEELKELEQPEARSTPVQEEIPPVAPPRVLPADGGGEVTPPPLPPPSHPPPQPVTPPQTLAIQSTTSAKKIVAPGLQSPLKPEILHRNKVKNLKSQRLKYQHNIDEEEEMSGDEESEDSYETDRDISVEHENIERDIDLTQQRYEEVQDEEMRVLLLKDMTLKLEEEELLAIRDELKKKIETERDEFEQVAMEIAELRSIRGDSFDADDWTSSDSSYESDDEEELQDILENLIKENQQLEKLNSELCQRIHEERQACLTSKVQIRLIQTQTEKYGTGSASLL